MEDVTLRDPTVGHRKLARFMKQVAHQEHGDAFLYLSHKQSPEKDPLSYEQKIHYADELLGEYVNVVNSPAKTIIFALHELNQKGYNDKLIYIGGEDRIGGADDMTAMISKYNGVEVKNESMRFKFNTIEFMSAGQRDETSDDIEERASASLARKYAAAADFEMFKQLCPVPDVDKMYDDVRKGMRIENLQERYLYHSVFNKDAEDFVDKNGIVRDEDNSIYLSEKPWDGPFKAKATYKVDIPDENNLRDWRELWRDEEGNDIDPGHVYDPNNPYWIYVDKDIPRDRLTKVQESYLREGTFSYPDIIKHQYLAQVINDLASGKGVKLKGGEMTNATLSAEDVSSLKGLAASISTTDKKVLADKFYSITNIKWTSIDKSPYSGRGGKGWNDATITGFQEALQGLILIGKINNEIIDNLIESCDILFERYLNFPEGSIKITDEFREQWEAFAYSWQGPLKKLCEERGNIISSLPSQFNITRLKLIHPSYKGSINSANELLKGADKFDKSDIYLAADDSAAQELLALKKGALADVNAFYRDSKGISKTLGVEAYVNKAQELLNAGRLLGISLKRNNEITVHMEYDPKPFIPSDFSMRGISDETFIENPKGIYYHPSKPRGSQTTISTTKITFPTSYGEGVPLQLECRSSGEGQFVIQFLFAGSKAWAGRCKHAFESIFDSANYKKLEQAAKQKNFPQAASIILSNLTGESIELGNEGKSLPMTEYAAINLCKLANLAIGYQGSINNIRVTAPYIKIF